MPGALLGWYACGFAAEPFLVSVVATYVPLFLEELARRNAVWVVDHRTPCLSAVPPDAPGIPPSLPPPQCVVQVLWWYIDTSSLPLYTFSFSVLVQTLLVISISGIADRGAHRKRLLITFGVVGSLSVLALFAISTTHYYIAALLAVAGNASFGVVSVCTNAYLPELVAQATENERKHQRTLYDRYSGATETPAKVDPGPIAATISGRGMAVAYGSALFVQIVTMVLLYRFNTGEQSTYMLQVVIALVGAWWLIFQIPIALWLPSNHLPPAVIAESETSLLNGRAVVNEPIWPLAPPTSLWEEITYGWKSLARTIPKARRLRDVSTFLVAWFLISDAVTTINSTAILFARGNLRMATPALAGVGLLTVCFGIIGSLFVGRLTRARFGTVGGLILIILFASFIPLYGVVGFFTPYLGLKNPWEMFLLAAWYGIALGALNATCRSIFSLLIPRGHEVMFFALFSLTDKGSSVLGPAITGIITDKTHNIRYTFYFLLTMALLSAVIFSRVDIERGQEEALTLADEEEIVG